MHADYIFFTINEHCTDAKVCVIIKKVACAAFSRISLTGDPRASKQALGEFDEVVQGYGEVVEGVLNGNRTEFNQHSLKKL